MCEAKKTMMFDVPEGLQSYAQDAVDRLSYLYPDVDFTFTGQDIALTSLTEIHQEKLNEEIRYTLYRSKIRAQGDADRSALFSAVFGR